AKADGHHATGAEMKSQDDDPFAALASLVEKLFAWQLPASSFDEVAAFLGTGHVQSRKVLILRLEVLAHDGAHRQRRLEVRAVTLHGAPSRRAIAAKR